MTITKYLNTSDERYLSKNLVSLGTGEIEYKSGCDILAPTLIIKDFPSNCNYIFIHDLNRYYYVTNVIVSGTIYQVECRIDVLNTYKDYISNINALVNRQEFDYDVELTDNNIVVKNTIEVGNIVVGQCGDSNFHFYLSTVGI